MWNYTKGSFLVCHVTCLISCLILWKEIAILSTGAYADESTLEVLFPFIKETGVRHYLFPKCTCKSFLTVKSLTNSLHEGLKDEVHWLKNSWFRYGGVLMLVKCLFWQNNFLRIENFKWFLLHFLDPLEIFLHSSFSGLVHFTSEPFISQNKFKLTKDLSFNTYLSRVSRVIVLRKKQTIAKANQW